MLNLNNLCIDWVRGHKAMSEETKPQGWWGTLPGIITALGALLTAVTGLIVALRHESKPAPPAGSVAVPVETRPAPSVPNLSGAWRDNWGTVSQLTQNGNKFQFTAEGTSCTGQYFHSTGSGSIDGNNVQTNYQSNLPSRGDCSGTLAANGLQIDSTCRDSVCGTFASSSVRQ